MEDKIYRNFLETQHERSMALAHNSDRVSLEPLYGDPPSAYLARFSCRGLIRNEHGGIEEHDRWNFEIRFPENYLRARVHVAEVITFLGPPNVWHPNFRYPFVCVNIGAGTPLDELLYALYDLLIWEVYGVRDDGLNPAAAQWARRQPPGRFPLDRRPLRRPARREKRP